MDKGRFWTITFSIKTDTGKELSFTGDSVLSNCPVKAVETALWSAKATRDQLGWESGVYSVSYVKDDTKMMMDIIKFSGIRGALD